MPILALPMQQQSSRDLHRFDEGYVQNLRVGEPQTVDHFVEYFRDLLRAKLRSRLRSRQLIEDACQETFLRVFRALRRGEEIRNPERLGAYVNAVCNHVLQELYRSEKRHRPTADTVLDEIEDGAPIQEDRLEAMQRGKLVRMVIAELPDSDRRLLHALFVEEADKDVICLQFNVERSYLRVLLHRAKQRFRTLYLKRSGEQSEAKG